MLSPKDQSDDFKFLPPARTGNKVEPLIDGERIFPAVEEAIAGAKESVYCTFWSIYPDTPLLSKKVRTALKVKDWQGLLIKIAKDNDVKVRILLSDFDPRIDNYHHQVRAWGAFSKFVAAAVKAGLTKDQFQVMVSRHPAVISDFVATKISKPELAKVIAKFNKSGLAGLENSPGIWGDVKLSGKKLSMAASPNFEVFPASHHQKTVVVDNKIGFLGGLNISDYFQDTPKHLKKEPAHDVFCRVEGSVVADLERNFVGRWNRETAGFNTFVTTANANGKALGKFKIDHRFPISTLSLSKKTLGNQGNAVAQVLRTLSNGIQSPIVGSYNVQVVRDDIARSYERAISLATDFIYIENQVMRLDDLANAIINRFKKAPKLQVIFVLPVVPEEIADGTADQITFHGQALQHDALTKLKSVLGKNVGLYSLLQKKKGTAKLTFLNSVQIDVHCKLIVVDDLFASIGSANASPRSFTLDSETNVAWYEPDTVKKFREDLWKEHLGSADGSLFASWKRSDYVKEWDAIARKNVKAKPESREGFVVPHDPNKEKGKKTPLLPDFLAAAGRTDQADKSKSRTA
jgi:phospholipase D1/2